MRKTVVEREMKASANTDTGVLRAVRCLLYRLQQRGSGRDEMGWDHPLYAVGGGGFIERERQYSRSSRPSRLQHSSGNRQMPSFLLLASL